MSNTQHKAQYVISVDLGRVFLLPTAMYTGKRPDGPGAPRPELFKTFVDSTELHEYRAAIRLFVLCSWTATDPERARPDLNESNSVALAR